MTTNVRGTRTGFTENFTIPEKRNKNHDKVISSEDGN